MEGTGQALTEFRRAVAPWLGRLTVIMLMAVSLAVTGVAQQAVPVRVQGQVLDGSGNPCSQAMVQVDAWNGGLLASGMTDSDGRFSIPVNQGGPYQIEVNAQGESVGATSTSGANVQIELPQQTPDVAASTVSINDLEVSGKARSRLNAAAKAIHDLQLDKAWRLANEAIAAAPNWGKAYLIRGVLNLESQRYSAAQADLVTAVNKDPKDGMALTELGKLYSTTGKLTLSNDYLQRALQLPPVLWPTYLEMANLDLMQGHYQDALVMARNAEFDTPPAPAAAHFLAADAAYHLKAWDTSAQEYRAFLGSAGTNSHLAAAQAVARQRLAKLTTQATPH